MATTMKDLGIDRFSTADRLALVHEIWDSIASSPEQLPLTDEQRRLIDQRLAGLDAHPTEVLNWEEIKAYVRASK